MPRRTDRSERPSIRGLTSELKARGWSRAVILSLLVLPALAARFPVRLDGSILVEDGNYDKTERDKASEVVERLVFIRWVI